MVFRIGNPSTLDVVMGSITIILMIEATRRAIGWGLPIIALFAMVYALFGNWFPGIFLHPGATWSTLVNHLYLTSQGVYGVALGVVATYVFHFVLFGVLATRIGLGRLFLGVAAAVAGRFAGGPAKVSIFGSALFGMISGSSVANTVTVGSLTIPMMIRLGYAAALRGRGGIDRRDRRPDHPADHGRGRLPDGRVPQPALRHHRHRRDHPRLHAFLRRADAGAFRGAQDRHEGHDRRRRAEALRGLRPRLADDRAAVCADHGAVHRLHALSRRLLGHHRLHACRPRATPRRLGHGLRAGDRHRGADRVPARAGRQLRLHGGSLRR